MYSGGGEGGGAGDDDVMLMLMMAVVVVGVGSVSGTRAATSTWSLASGPLFARAVLMCMQ